MGLSALIVEPEATRRAHFKNLTEQQGGFDKTVASATLTEAQERIRNQMKYDAIYISTRFDPVVVSRFIQSSRSVKSSSSTHLIVVSRDSNNQTMKQYELGKPDGYLLEPIVAKDLDASVDFVHKHQKILTNSTPKSPIHPPVNIKALCARMAVAIDRGKAGLKDLRELSKKVDMLTEDEKIRYYEELVRYLGDFVPPTK